MKPLPASDEGSTVAWTPGYGGWESRVHRHQAPTPTKGAESMPEGYCVKERKKVEIQNPVQVTMKNGRPAIQGTCPDCGTKIFKIGKLDQTTA
jgi:Domain of unknown function (DUF5679)